MVVTSLCGGAYYDALSFHVSRENLLEPILHGCKLLRTAAPDAICKSIKNQTKHFIQNDFNFDCAQVLQTTISSKADVCKMNVTVSGLEQ